MSPIAAAIFSAITRTAAKAASVSKKIVTPGTINPLAPSKAKPGTARKQPSAAPGNSTVAKNASPVVPGNMTVAKKSVKSTPQGKTSDGKTSDGKKSDVDKKSDAESKKMSTWDKFGNAVNILMLGSMFGMGSAGMANNNQHGFAIDPVTGQSVPGATGGGGGNASTTMSSSACLSFCVCCVFMFFLIASD